MKHYILGMAAAFTLAACGGESGPAKLDAFPAGGVQGKVVIRNVSATDINVLSFEPIINNKLADYYVRPQPQLIAAGTTMTYSVPVGEYSVSGGKGFKFLIGPMSITVRDGQTVTITSAK